MELLDLAVKEIHQHHPYSTKLDRSVEHYLHYVEGTTGKAAELIDIEEFIAYLDHAHILGLRGSDTWSDQGNEDELILRWGIGAALHHATPAPERLPSMYLQFAQRLRPGDCIISFNYDMVLETALDAAGVPYRRFPHRFTECLRKPLHSGHRTRWAGGLALKGPWLHRLGRPLGVRSG